LKTINRKFHPCTYSHHHLLAIAEKGCCLLMQRDTQQGLWWVVGSEVGFNWNWGLEQITSPFAMENIL
jgi:hypothetical protein